MILQNNIMKKLFILALFGLALFSCSKDDDRDNNISDNTITESNSCELETLVSAEEYKNSLSDPLTINSLEIIDGCLKISFSAGGCGGDTWELELIDSGDILESYPPQRNVKLSLKNEELCKAYITKEVTFDISNLKVDGDRVQLNFLNSDKGILYEY